MHCYRQAPKSVPSTPSFAATTYVASSKKPWINMQTQTHKHTMIDQPQPSPSRTSARTVDTPQSDQVNCVAVERRHASCNQGHLHSSTRSTRFRASSHPSGGAHLKLSTSAQRSAPITNRLPPSYKTGGLAVVSQRVTPSRPRFVARFVAGTDKQQYSAKNIIKINTIERP